MKKCPKCQADLPNDAKFCTRCGAKIEGVKETPKAASEAPQPEPKKKSNAWKWVLIILAILMLLGVLGVGGCLVIGKIALDKYDEETVRLEEEMAFLAEEDLDIERGEVKKDEPEIKKETKVEKPTVSPEKTVELYMTYTLGTIAGSDVDYDKAKQYLDPTLKKEFTDPTFVPMSYCIQNGPDKVKVKSENISGNFATVRVSAQYGSGYSSFYDDMWDFKLVIQDGKWKIKEIKCLNM